jgi:tetratricopeptide (TPR) repeat protein
VGRKAEGKIHVMSTEKGAAFLSWWLHRIENRKDWGDGLKKEVLRNMICCMAGCLKECGEIDEALEVIKEGLNYFPGNKELKIIRGRLLLEKKEYGEAIRIFKKCESYKWLGRTYEKLGQYDKALEYYVEAYKKNREQVCYFISIFRILGKIIGIESSLNFLSSSLSLTKSETKLLFDIFVNLE